jgi:presequence protease
VLGGFCATDSCTAPIREQGGAYGGGASTTPDRGISLLFLPGSAPGRDPGRLRPPRIDWLQQDTLHDWQQVEEAILGVIGSIDKPASPAGEAKKHFHETLFGRDIAQRRAFRQRVLGVTLEDLLRVGATYLDPARASTAVVTNAVEAEQLRKQARFEQTRLQVL